MILERGTSLLCIGDSITDCGRERPVGEDTWQTLGNGYVSMLSALIGAKHPELAVRVRNVGTSGNTVRDLKARWETDVFDLKPDVLPIMIGTNDVWRQFDYMKNPDAAVLPEEYADTLDQLVVATIARGIKVVLMTPFFIEPLLDDPMRKRMDEYSAIVRETAERHKLPFVDVQGAFDRLLAHQHSSAIAWDRIHPSQTGHMAIALALYRALIG